MRERHYGVLDCMLMLPRGLLFLVRWWRAHAHIYVHTRAVAEMQQHGSSKGDSPYGAK